MYLSNFLFVARGLVELELNSSHLVVNKSKNVCDGVYSVFNGQGVKVLKQKIGVSIGLEMFKKQENYTVQIFSNSSAANPIHGVDFTFLLSRTMKISV